MTLIDTPGVFIPGRAASLLAPALKRLLKSARRDAVSVDPDVVVAIEEIERAGARYEANRATSPQPMFAEPSCAPSEFITVARAAIELGCTEQNVRKALGRGTLAGRKTATGWQVSAASVAARRAKKENQ